MQAPRSRLDQTFFGNILQTVSKSLEESRLWVITNVGTMKKSGGRTIEEGVYYINSRDYISNIPMQSLAQKCWYYNTQTNTLNEYTFAQVDDKDIVVQ